MPVPQEFLNLLPKGIGEGPVYYLWVFDPMTGQVTVENNEGRHPAEAITHESLAYLTPHPSRVHGYAYRIRDGWRITDIDHRPVKDPYIVSQVLKSVQ